MSNHRQAVHGTRERIMRFCEDCDTFGPVKPSSPGGPMRCLNCRLQDGDGQ